MEVIFDYSAACDDILLFVLEEIPLRDGKKADGRKADRNRVEATSLLCHMMAQAFFHTFPVSL